MTTVPHRLLDLPIVNCHHRDEGLVVLSKRTDRALHERPSYVALHALSLVSEGEQVVYADDQRRLRIPTGGVGLLRRGLYTITDLLADASGGFAATVVFFDDACLREALAALGSSVDAAVPTRVLAAAPAAHAWVDTLSRPPEQPGPPEAGAQRAWRRRFAELLECLVADEPALLGALHGLLATPRRPLRDFMRAHFDKPLTLADYAHLTGRSERSFRRDFRARFGESPKKWLVARRLERAHELLHAPASPPVHAIAEEVGYASASHFIKLYRERFGVTPGAVAATVAG